MGTGRVPLKVNSKGKKDFECMEEMHAFMQCFAVSVSHCHGQHQRVSRQLDNLI